MKHKFLIVIAVSGVFLAGHAHGEAMLQLFNLTWNQISDKMPELAEAGYQSLWLPPPAKANSQFSAGYDMFDPFDLGDKDQKGTIATRYGTKDELIRMVKIAHRFGIRVYFDNIMNHRSYDVPGYDAYTPITVYPGLLPEDFHLRLTSDGFFRKWDNVSNWGDTWQVQNRNFSDLIDLSQEQNVNYNFGYTEGSTAPKLNFVRQPFNPEYYAFKPGPGYVGFGNVTQTDLNNNPAYYTEDTAAYLIRAVRWFIHTTKCDGLRLDAVKHVPATFFGDTTGTGNGYTGGIQQEFDVAHGYLPANGYTESDDNRNSNYDAEATRNDALIFGEHLGEPPAYSDYLARGQRLVDSVLSGQLNSGIGDSWFTWQGLEQRDSGGFTAAQRVMYAQSHDNGYAKHRELQLPYMFFREGIASLYSDGYYQSSYCKECGGDAFPRIADTHYLGQWSDHAMPEFITLHGNLARGGSRARWGDQHICAWERYDYRETATTDLDSTVVFFALNGNFGYPGDAVFVDYIGEGCSGAVCKGYAMPVGFKPGTVLVNLATASPGYDRTYKTVTVKTASSDGTWVAGDSSTRAKVNYTPGNETGAIEILIPSGGYVVYSIQPPEASRPSGVFSNSVITFEQGGVPAPRMTVRRTDGRDGDTGFNPFYPFKARGSINPDGSYRTGSNVSNLTYAIDIPVITNSTPFNILIRTDASTADTLVRFDGGLDVNSHMNLGPTNQTTGGMSDNRDYRPGYVSDLFLGYERTALQGRQGPEKFAARDTARNTVVSAGAETYSYTVGGTTNVVNGSGGASGVTNSTAQWVYHDPGATVTKAHDGQPTQMNPLTPTGGQSVDLWAKVAKENNVNKGYIYYTTDGSNPEGAFGVGKGTTLVVESTFQDDDASDATIDWWKGTIPNYPSSTTVKYKIAFHKTGIAEVSDADWTKVFGQSQFAITNFNPSTTRVWLHNDLNTNSTSVGLERGFHVVRARAYLPRTPIPNTGGRYGASIYNTYVQTFYYDPAPPSGVIAFPANNGDTLGSSQYGVVVRADPTTTEVWYNIQDASAANDDVVTGNTRGNGNSNGVPIYVRATQVSADPSLGQTYPNYPYEYRFNYVGIPSSGSATITVLLKELTTASITNRFTTLTRTVNCAAPSVSVQIAFPQNDGDTIYLDQADSYQIVTCFSNTLDPTLTNFTIKIDGAVQPRYTPGGTPLYLIQGSYCGAGKTDLRYFWSGMSAGTHLIELLYEGDGYVLQDSRVVNVQLTGIAVNIINPPAADAFGNSPYTITFSSCTGGNTNNSFTIITSTSLTVTDVINTVYLGTNVSATGHATQNTNNAASTLTWEFGWSNIVAGSYVIRADATGGGSNTTYRNVNVNFRAVVALNTNVTDDADNDGLTDTFESQNTALPDTASDNWNNGDVHIWTFTGRSNPQMADTDGDGVPDGLELGIGPASTATNTLIPDPNCGGTNFIADIDPPIYNTLDNESAPAGYAGFNPWPFDRNKSRTDLLAGTVTDPGKPDTDYDGLKDGIEDMKHNGRLDIGLMNSSGVVTGIVAHPPTIYNTSTIDRAKVIQVWPNAIWLETDPNNSDTDGDSASDGYENGSGTGFLKIGLLNHTIGYSSGSYSVTGILANAVLYSNGTSRVNRNALIQQFPNAVLLDTDPMDAHTDGDPGGLPDGWKLQHGLNPWDDGVVGHTNWNTGALITTNLHGAAGNPTGDGISNYLKYLNGLDPWKYYSNGIPTTVGDQITVGSGPVIGTTAGVAWRQEFQDWKSTDLKAMAQYDGNGSLKRNRSIYPLYDGFDWSRDIIAFYARDGGDGNYYFRVDSHDMTFGADQGKMSIYVAINIGQPGLGNKTFPENLNTTTDMGWHVLVAVYGNTYGANTYVKQQGSLDNTYVTYPGVNAQYWRADLDAVEFSIPKARLTEAGWLGVTPLCFQVFVTGGGGNHFGWRSDIVKSIYDSGIAESDNTGYGNKLFYYFSTQNQNAMTVGDYNYNNGIISQHNPPNIAKVAVMLHGNQAILPSSIIQNLISNSTQRTTGGTDATWDPGNQPTGYYRALELAQTFGIPLNLHLSGSLISALQWASSTNSSVDGPKFNQRIASMVASGQVALLTGMFADHIAPYFTGAVNHAGIQLQDSIMRTVYGSNAVSTASPIYLSERVVDGKTMADLAANSGHTTTILDQMVHLWWWGEQLYGFGNGRQVALSDAGYQMNRFNGLNAFLISGVSDQMYSYYDLGTTIALRETLQRKAMSGTRDQVIILGDNWEAAGSNGGGNHNADALVLNLRWIANHPWIKIVALDKFATGQVDINNDGTLTDADIPYVQDRGTANFSLQAKELIRHNSRTSYDNWYYGSTGEEAFFSKKPPIRNGTNAWYNLGHVQTNGTILARAWADTTGTLSNLAKLVYLNGIFETAFHGEDNNNTTRYSTGDYVYPDTTATDTLSAFAYKPNSRLPRQASIIGKAAAFWTNATAIATNFTADVDNDGESEYILANDRIYSVFERTGGRLVAAFARDPAAGNAYQVIGNLASTPEYETEDEGESNISAGAIQAYKTSGFKDWWAVSGASTNLYINDYYTVTATNVAGRTGWRLASSDNKIIKAITLGNGTNTLEAAYNLTSLTGLYIRHGLSPDLLALLFNGQAGLTTTNTGGRVSVRNVTGAANVVASLNYADTGHSGITYNSSATDNNNTNTIVAVNMRNQAQTHQVELQSTSTSFTFGLQLIANDCTADPDSDGLSNCAEATLGTNPTNADTDADGMLDGWESVYRNPLIAGNPNADPDGDGMTDLQESVTGTNPDDANSLMRILNITPAGSSCQLTWTSIPGKTYEIYTTADLTQPFLCISGCPVISSGGTTTTYSVPGTPGVRLYYKVRVRP